MRLMRGLIHEFNVYRWAGRMLLDAATMRRGVDFAGREAFPLKRTRATDAPFAAPVEATARWSTFSEAGLR
jgi:hypothetical protein